MSSTLLDFYKKQGLFQDGSLLHWGIKGMRWGVRRSDAELARIHGSSSADAIRARETLNSIRKAGSVSAASDADLNHLINRINVEKRYTDAISVDSALKKGDKAVTSLLRAGTLMNEAVKFYDSEAGRILAAHLGLHTKTIGKHSASGRHRA